MAAAREREESELVPFLGDQRAAPGRWTAKDVLAHNAVWREMWAAELRSLQAGEQSPARVSEDVDAVNRDIFDRTHGLPAAEVIARSRRSWELLDAAFEATPDAILDRAVPRDPNRTYWDVVANQTCTHLTAHIAGWRSERGEEAAFEAITRWARDLAVEAFPELREAGACEYNLGCFFAARGRAAEALPYLRRGLELRPDLRDWARQDSDLDPIRSHPDVAALLAGEPA